MFNEEKQKAILASAYNFAEHDIIIKSPVPPINTNEACNQQEFMCFIYSAFDNMGKKWAAIVKYSLFSSLSCYIGF
jgi:hypothetical protein